MWCDVTRQSWLGEERKVTSGEQSSGKCWPFHEWDVGDKVTNLDRRLRKVERVPRSWTEGMMCLHSDSPWGVDGNVLIAHQSQRASKEIADNFAKYSAFRLVDAQGN